MAPQEAQQALDVTLAYSTLVSIRLYVYLGAFSGAVDRTFVFFVLKTFLVSADTREAHCFYLDGMLIWGGR